MSKKQHKGKLFEKAIAIAKSQVISVHQHKYCPSVYYCHSNAKYVLAMEIEGEDCFRVCCVNAQSTVTLQGFKKRYSLMDADADLTRVAYRHEDGKTFEKAADGWDLYDAVLAEQGKPPQNPRQATTVDSTDLQRMDDQNYNRLQLQPWLQNEAEIIGSLHIQAKQMAQVSILLAAKAGAMLNDVKNKCEHGEWMDFMKSLPFSTETARRYRGLADEFSKHFVGNNAIDLLQLPGADRLASPEYESTIQAVKSVTGEKTLGQLYFDWDILKVPGKKGGIRPSGTAKPLEPGETLLHHTANSVIGHLQHDILRSIIEPGTRVVQHLNLEELKHIHETLKIAKSEIEELIKAG